MARTKQKAKNTAWLYKIVSNTLGTYVGLTHEKYWTVRIKNHLAQFKLWKNGGKKFCHSFLVLKDESATFSILESFQYEGRWQGNETLKNLLSSKERYWKEKLNAVNKNVPGRTKAERDQSSYLCECGQTLKYSSKWGHLASQNHHRRMVAKI